MSQRMPNALEHIPSEAEPIQLITIASDENGKDVFELNFEALAVLQNIDTPVGVVAMCGGIRLGKSFLLNTIIGQSRNNGVSRGYSHFSTRSFQTVQSCGA